MKTARMITSLRQPRPSWIGVDLDGTLAHYNGWQGIEHVGAPIAPMLARVKAWLAEGRSVKIFTARVSCSEPERTIAERAIHKWLVSHGLPRLEVTNAKDFGMVEVWDDRAIQVIANTGIAIRAPA